MIGCQENHTTDLAASSVIDRSASHRESMTSLAQKSAAHGSSLTPSSLTPSSLTPSQANQLNALQKSIAVAAVEINQENLDRWQNEFNTIVIILDDDTQNAVVNLAAKQITQAGLKLGYFIEVGRNPKLADAHPTWMASLQGHAQWRQQFPDSAMPTKRQVVKNYPWVPILYKETFAAHLERIKILTASTLTPATIYLNDLQGAPSACGCGHPLCRWTADYGPILTATPLGNDAAAKFTQQVQRLFPESNVIPIFVSECEQADKDTVCCGVACFEGRCWKDFTKQLDPLADVANQIGVACFFKEFQRNLPRYPQTAGFVRYALDSFESMPKLRAGKGVAPTRLIAVLQGWEVTAEEIQAQIDRAREANALGYLLIKTPIDQSWEPRIIDLPDNIPSPEELNHNTTDHDHDHDHDKSDQNDKNGS